MSFNRPFSALILATTVCTSGCLSVDDASGPRAEKAASHRAEIVGGHTIDITQAPWQVSLQDGDQHFCGGLIVSADWVLTAQHCLRGVSDRLRVVAGISRLSQGDGQVRSVAEIVRYPGYEPSHLSKDIALLRLSTPIDLSTPYAKAIGLVSAAQAEAGATAEGVPGLVAGWGRLSTSDPSPDALMQVETPLVSQEFAIAAHASFTEVTEDMIGAGGSLAGHAGTCFGDSGGALVVPNPDGSGYLAAGVVSFGRDCGAPALPSMYARVSYFEDWIRQQIRSSLVTFSCQEGWIDLGQSVYVSGSSPSLGEWDPARAVLLSVDQYPRWTGMTKVPIGETVRWKCLKRSDQAPAGMIEWAPGAENILVVPESATTSAEGTF